MDRSIALRAGFATLALVALPLIALLGTASAEASTVPACSYGDVLTTNRAYSQYPVTIVDTWLRLPSTYAPSLVSVGNAGFSSGGVIRPEVVADLKAMRLAAKAASAPIAIRSAYRSYATQVSTFQYWVSVGGYAMALRTSARAGHSEHQLGTALDFMTPGGPLPWNVSDWATTRAGAWMGSNAWRYGFVMSYPKGAFSRTCYDYEPWHYRYVGRAQAARVHDSGLTLREWLFRYGTAPAPTPVPTPTPSPTPVPLASRIPIDTVGSSSSLITITTRPGITR